MDAIPERDNERIVQRLRQQAEAGMVRVTLHGHREMVAEDISYEALRDALLDPQVLENYPDHQRGPCCLVVGRTRTGRFLHVVCTTAQEILVVITVYEPLPPKWPTPFARGGRLEL